MPPEEELLEDVPPDDDPLEEVPPEEELLEDVPPEEDPEELDEPEDDEPDELDEDELPVDEPVVPPLDDDEELPESLPPLPPPPQATSVASPNAMSQYCNLFIPYPVCKTNSFQGGDCSAEEMGVRIFLTNVSMRSVRSCDTHEACGQHEGRMAGDSQTSGLG